MLERALCTFNLQERGGLYKQLFWHDFAGSIDTNKIDVRLHNARCQWSVSDKANRGGFTFQDGHSLTLFYISIIFGAAESHFVCTFLSNMIG